MGELKPCPFCGNDLIKVDRMDQGMVAWCTNCLAQGPTLHFGPDGTAKGAWNDVRCGEENAAMAAQLALLLELEQALDRGMASVDRMRPEDRHQDFIDGLQCVDAAVRAWVAQQRAALQPEDDA
tara:strand:- start:2 stop:373 length:372 start_codon:yes stop_codon:yes gene_type:complete